MTVNSKTIVNNNHSALIESSIREGVRIEAIPEFREKILFHLQPDDYKYEQEAADAIVNFMRTFKNFYSLFPSHFANIEAEKIREIETFFETEDYKFRFFSHPNSMLKTFTSDFFMSPEWDYISHTHPLFMFSNLIFSKSGSAVVERSVKFYLEEDNVCLFMPSHIHLMVPSNGRHPKNFDVLLRRWSRISGSSFSIFDNLYTSVSLIFLDELLVKPLAALYYFYESYGNQSPFIVNMRRCIDSYANVVRFCCWLYYSRQNDEYVILKYPKWKKIGRRDPVYSLLWEYD